MNQYIEDLAKTIQIAREQSDLTRNKNLTIIKQILKHIQKENITDFTDIAKDQNSIIYFLDSPESSKTLNTRLTKYYAFLTYLNYFKDDPKLRPFYKKIYKICDDLNIERMKMVESQEKTDKEIEKWDENDFDKLVEILDNFKTDDNMTIADYTSYVATCLFVYQEPRRANDYVMRVVEEYDEDLNENQYIKAGLFCFKKYKTASSFGIQTFPINPKLKNIIKKYHQFLTVHGIPQNKITHLLMFAEGKPVDDSNQISIKVKTFLSKYMKKPMSINSIRHMFIENFYKKFPNSTFAEKKKLSQKMAHDLTTQMTYVKIKKEESNDEPEKTEAPAEVIKTSQEILNDVYTEFNKSIGMDKMYRILRDRGHLITQKQVREFIKSKTI